MAGELTPATGELAATSDDTMLAASDAPPTPATGELCTELILLSLVCDFALLAQPGCFFVVGKRVCGPCLVGFLFAREGTFLKEIPRNLVKHFD